MINSIKAIVTPMAIRQPTTVPGESRMGASPERPPAPDLVMASAGFDAHRRDPLAHQSLEEADYAWATRAVIEVSRKVCGGRVVSTLEGGYDLEALGRSSAAHARALGEV